MMVEVANDLVMPVVPALAVAFVAAFPHHSWMSKAR